MTTMRAKMRVASVDPQGVGSERVTFSAIARNGAYPEGGLDEDNTFARYSPNACLGITICNPALLGKFGVGDVFYVDFTPAPAPTPAG